MDHCNKEYFMDTLSNLPNPQVEHLIILIRLHKSVLSPALPRLEKKHVPTDCICGFTAIKQHNMKLIELSKNVFHEMLQMKPGYIGSVFRRLSLVIHLCGRLLSGALKSCVISSTWRFSS